MVIGMAEFLEKVGKLKKTQEKIDLKQIILSKSKELGSRTEAIRFAMRNHPTEYLAMRDNNQLNF
jgi:hypothetical protein